MRKPAMIDGTMIILPPKEETPKTLTEREDGTYTYTDEWGTTTIYQDAAGEAVLGYEITYSWGSNKYTTTYNANWEMQSSISTEGNRTTEYGNVDGVWTLVSLTVDYGAMNAIEEDGYTVYKENNGDGAVTTYYKDAATDTLVKYSVSYIINYTYNDWMTGKEITNIYTSTSDYDAQGHNTGYQSSYTDSDGNISYYESTNQYNDKGELVGYSGKSTDSSGYVYTYESTNQYNDKGELVAYTSTSNDTSGYQSSDQTTHNYDESGIFTGSTSTTTWSDKTTTSKTITKYNAQWQTISSETTTTSTSTDEAGNESISKTVSTTQCTYGDDGRMTGYDITETSDKGTTETHYDAPTFPDYPYPCYDVGMMKPMAKMGGEAVVTTPITLEPLDMATPTVMPISMVDPRDDSGKTISVLSGNGDNNLVEGTKDGDNMMGGAGNDVYYVNHKQDKIYETTSLTDSTDAGGEDRVEASISHTLGKLIEDLTLTGKKAINGTGNALDNKIVGNLAINKLNGKTGNDVINGGLGNDKLTGGSGEDTFIFDTQLNSRKNKDTITDFSVKFDTIQLDNSVFSKLTEGSLSQDHFVSNKTGKAVDADDFVIYNTQNHTLSYDADGNGKGKAVDIVVIGNKVNLTIDDIMII